MNLILKKIQKSFQILFASKTLFLNYLNPVFFTNLRMDDPMDRIT